MADFNKGRTFKDKEATDYSGVKGKYFISLTDADYDDDIIGCFRMNTERRMDKYHIGCNKEYFRFIIEPNKFSFITEHTSIMLVKECFYQLHEMYEDHIELLDIADDLLLRRIKNCIDWNSLLPKTKKLIMDCF